MMEFLGLAVEISLLLVLVYAVIIGTKIGKNFSDLKKGEREMRSLFVHFKDVIERAENTMRQAKLETQENHDELITLFKDADQLRNDLEYMLDRSKSISERMEENIRTANNINANSINTNNINATLPMNNSLENNLDPQSDYNKEQHHNRYFQPPNNITHQPIKPNVAAMKDSSLNTIKRQAFTPPNDDVTVTDKPKMQQKNNKVNLLKAIEGMR